MKAGAFWEAEALRGGNAEPGMPLTRRVEEGTGGVRLDFFTKVAFVYGLGALAVVVVVVVEGT